MKKTMIFAIAAVGLTGAGIAATTLAPQPSRVAQTSTAAAGEAPVMLQTASFAIENMTCATCPITVRRAMEGVSGVSDVAIDYETKIASARFDPERTTIKAIAAASTNAGYPARHIEANRS